ncbi:MAG TPA: outer membrane beta-barrel protein [Fluviicoccus sp.]|nr:outer membrane beta-barrel protein [Fluviicoccus sp.]
MNIRICLPLLLAVSTVSTMAVAGDNYVGADVMLMTYEEPGLPSADFKGLQVKFGTELDSGIGFEARLGTGLSDAEHKNITIFVPGIGLANGNGTSNMDLMLGAYMTANLPVNDTFKVYGLFGITSIELTQEGTFTAVGFPPVSFSSSSRDTSLSLGAGVSVAASDSVSVSLEYVSLYDKDDVTIKGLNLGVKSKF